MISINDDIKRVAKYLFVGGSSALLELFLFQALYALLGWQIALANVFAVVIATTYNFLLNRSWAFEQKSNSLRSVVLYLLLFFLNTTFSTAVITFLVSAGVISMLAKLFTQACIVLWNYVLYRKVIFK